ncbi:MAG TPA: TolC family protein [Candidatus Acidoferrales bacterium]|nr:TolC family protein [Candidatus Acidoferrales bacterium]
MMKATIERGEEEIVLKVEGKVSGLWVDELRRCWESLLATAAGHPISVELTDVGFIDERGKELLSMMAETGAKIRGKGCFTAAIVNSIRPGKKEDGAAGNSSERRSRGAQRFLIIPLLIFLAVGMASAQQNGMPSGEGGAAPMQLNLHQAVQMALKENPSVQIAALNLAESQKDKNVALAKLLPQADLNVSEHINRLNLQAQIGLTFPGFPKAVGPFQVVQGGADFSTQVFDLSLWRKWQASREDVTTADAQRQSVREQIVLLVVSQYLTALRQHAEVTAADAEVKLAQALYDQGADMEKRGVATGVDVLRANVELQNQKQGLIVAQTNEQIALYGLAKLLNIDPQQKIELADQASFSETPNVDENESLNAAYQARPEMRALGAEEQSLEYRKRADSDSRLPALHFDGEYEQEGTQLNNVIPTYVLEGAVSVPIFTGGRIHNEIARDSLEMQKVQQRMLDEKNQVALDVRTAIAELDSARNQVQVANLGVQLAKEEVDQAQDRFHAGVADNIEVTTAQDALARAYENQISALYQYNQSRADLAHAIGKTEFLYNE